MEWQKIMSEKYQQYYWFNSVTGESKWTEPEGWIEPPAKRLKTETPEEINSTNSNSTSSSTSTTTTTTPATTINTQREDVDIAIIVPFRDLHSEQKRFEQLQRFVPEMTRFTFTSSPHFLIHSNTHLIVFYKLLQKSFTFSSSNNQMMVVDSTEENYSTLVLKLQRNNMLQSSSFMMLI